MRHTALAVALLVLLFGATPSLDRQTIRAQTRPRTVSTNTDAILRSARTIYVRSHTGFLSSTTLEQALLNDKGVQWCGLTVTRDTQDADLILEVNRKVFNVFVYNVIESRTGRIVAGGKIGSLGGTVESQVARSVGKRLRQAQPVVLRVK